MSPSPPRRFESLLAEHLGAMLSFARRRCRDDESAREVVQEASLDAWRGYGALRDPGAARAWLFRILRLRLADHHRKTARRAALASIESLGEQVDQVLTSADPGPFERLLDHVERTDLRRLLCRLPREYAEVVRLVDLEGLRYAEAADRLGVTVGTVTSRLHRGRHGLIALAADSQEVRNGAL